MGANGRGLHVLMVPSFYQTPERPYNGTFFRDWALALQRAGARVGVAFVEDRSLRGVSVLSLRDSRFQIIAGDEDGLPTVRMKAWNTLAQWTAGGWVWSRLMERTIRAYIDRYGPPDVLAPQSALWAGEAARIASDHRVPYVVTEVNTAFGTGRLRPAERRLSQRIFADARGVIAISRNLQRRLTELTGRADVALVPCTVDEEYWTLPPPGLRGRGPFTFYGQAHLTARKGFHLLIQAFADHFRGDDSVRLVIGGEGVVRGDLERHAAASGVGSQVTFLGSLPRDGVRQAMWNADVFVLPSLAENFGVVLIEAMATGLPLISTRCGGPEDVITPDTGWLCEPGDVAGLGAALRSLRGNPPPVAQALRDSAISRFGYGAVGPRLRDFYRAAVQP